MLKASGGGGGRGMRIVDGEKDIISSFDSCMRGNGGLGVVIFLSNNM